MFSTCAAFVRCLVNSLESELCGVSHLCNICARFGGQLGSRFPWCFHGCGICGGQIRVRMQIFPFCGIIFFLSTCLEAFFWLVWRTWDVLLTWTASLQKFIVFDPPYPQYHLGRDIIVTGYSGDLPIRGFSWYQKTAFGFWEQSGVRLG